MARGGKWSQSVPFSDKGLRRLVGHLRGGAEHVRVEIRNSGHARALVGSERTRRRRVGQRGEKPGDTVFISELEDTLREEGLSEEQIEATVAMYRVGKQNRSGAEIRHLQRHRGY